MTDMVCCEVHFNSVFAKGSFWHGHNAGRVHDYVDFWHVGPAEKCRGCFTDGLLCGKVHVEEFVGDVWEV